uniref:hypothetical protein n=1 Tax=Zooshikella ganghwensis TaxID=202772 RepID=UPI00146FB726
YNRIGRGESNTTDGSDFRNRYTTTPLRRENFGRAPRRTSFANTNIENAQNKLSQEQINNMSPIDVFTYFDEVVGRNGDGGSLYFGPDSKMSQLFSQGKGAQTFERFLYDKFGGKLKNGDRVDDFGYAFNTSRFFRTNNIAEHVVGSWGGGKAVVVDQTILFRATNTMGVSSLFAGRYTEKWFGWSIGPKASDVHMTIEWTSQVRNQ